MRVRSVCYSPVMFASNGPCDAVWQDVINLLTEHGGTNAFDERQRQT